MIKKLVYIALVFCFGFWACQKEYSFEGNFTGESNGTLKDSSGNCHQMVLAGKYEMDTALTTNNYVLAKVNFTATGKWFIKSDTVNGIWFLDSGYTTQLGMQTLRVQGYGTPILPIVFDVNLYYRNSSCKFVCNASGMPIGPQPLIRDYFPTTKLSNWGYFNSLLNDTFHLKVLPNDSIINGLTYSIFDLVTPLTGTKDTLLCRKDGLGNYFRYYSVARGPLRDFAFLKDHEPVNTSWESPTVNLVFNSLTTQAKIKFTILDRNVSVNLNSRNFDSVIRVKEEWQYLIAGSFQTLNEYEHWYAKNIGEINFLQFSATNPLNFNLRRWRVY